MKPWQYALANWVVFSLGAALDATGHPILSLPCLILVAFGFVQLIRKRQKQ